MGSESSSSSQWRQPCPHYEFPQILLATKNFDESLVIGRGGFGKVYRGNIFNGSTPVYAAIKRLDPMSSQGAAEFWAEVEMLSKLRHCHLVSLIGYCNYGKEMILVYEYMPHGTLADHLHKFSTPLSWLQRLKICIGAARGLDYLHTGTGIELGVIHRDVKSSNILLQESWEAKISDFGLSKIGPKNRPSTYVDTLVRGTHGYIDPEYHRTGRLTRKSDVFAFGVVLFEVLCRKRAVDSSLDEEHWGLVRWVQDSIKQGSLKRIIDPGLRDQISPKSLKDFARIAGRCLHDHPKQRPTMGEVVFSLESVLAHSLQPAGRTIFGRMVDMLSFPSKEEHSAHGDSKPSSNSQGNKGRPINPSLKVFKFADLKRATSDFSEETLLGEGGFGKVFLGWVDKNTFAPSTLGVGIAVAVKRLDQETGAIHAKCRLESSILGWLAHPNIISLLGYCCDEPEYLLVYEYMQNGSLHRLLHRNASEPLSWRMRLIILMGVARGLAYLSQVQVIHRDFKSSNIFLDQDFNAKLGNFWNATDACGICNAHDTEVIVGTLGYVDPEYYMTGRATVKNDIYSFGVVLLEALTCLRPFDLQRPEERQKLADWVSELAQKGELKKIIDPHLEQNYSTGGVFKCFALALRCVALESKDRPSSEEVLRCLEEIYANNE